MTDLVTIHTCPCTPEKNFSTKATFKKHQESQRHQLWSALQSVQRMRQEIVDLSNKLSRMTLEKDHWKDEVFRLKEKHEPTKNLLD